jgi:hypothetical protein
LFLSILMFTYSPSDLVMIKANKYTVTEVLEFDDDFDASLKLDK